MRCACVACRCARAHTAALGCAPQTQLDELVFEQFGFRSALIAPAPALVAYDPALYGAAGAAPPPEADPLLLVPPAAALAAAQRSRTMLVLDCGFSYTCAHPASAAAARLTKQD